jgi:uncharacterized membrane protein YciS (DUF1049 family)
MKLLKWVLVIVVTVVVTCILLFTFTQEPFKASAQIKIPWCNLPSFPILWYVGATFAIGLLIGFFATAYYYIVGQAGIRAKKKEIKRLEGRIAEKSEEADGLRNSVGQTKNEIKRLEGVIAEMSVELEGLRDLAGAGKKKGTATVKAVGEKDFV